jgi:hypothetical protein
LKERRPTDVGAEDEAMVKEKVGGVSWLCQEIGAADKDLPRRDGEGGGG